MNQLVQLRSKIDDSINFAIPGSFEWRYVRRVPEYFIAYLSSQSACSQGCKFCHLTITGQTRPTNATADEMLAQASQVIDHYKTQARAEVVHFNFMARGEPLLNKAVDDGLFVRLSDLAMDNGLRPNFLVSTIMPKTFRGSLSQRFHIMAPEICYSLYSTNDKFRQKWLPSAMPIKQAMDELKRWQVSSGKSVKIHFAMINGENDLPHDIGDIVSLINEYELSVNINLIQYNPPDMNSEPASDEAYQEAVRLFKLGLPNDSIIRVIPKVGYDVKASCGMFLTPDR